VIDIELTGTPIVEAAVDLVVVGVHSEPRDGADGPDAAPPTGPGRPTPGAIAVLERLGVDAGDELAALGVTGALGSTVRIATRGTMPARAVLLVGLGPADGSTRARLRRVGGVIAGAAARDASLATDLATVVPSGSDAAEALRALAEGLALGSYRFDAYRTRPRPNELARAVLHVDPDGLAGAGRALELAVAGARAALTVRDLVNTPPQDKRPPALAERVVGLLEGSGVSVTVLDEAALAAGGYGGILAVGQGSSAPPRLVELDWSPADAVAHVAIVGKGITFDTGGISLKPSEAMETMKMDMAGAATVAAVVRAAAELALPVRITGVLALAENMPSGTATRVSDVLTTRSGRTVEVMNTDAEGRLVLADGIAHAAERGATTIVDVATLTGAVIIALGDDIAALIGHDDALADALLASAARADEPMWRLPLAAEHYGGKLEGMHADLRNVTGRAAGTIMGALFLHRFVPEGVAWAHLDIAGVAWSADDGPLRTKGGTGAPARTLLDWLVTTATR
jgi:leucyl aminopeptidase